MSKEDFQSLSAPMPEAPSAPQQPPPVEDEITVTIRAFPTRIRMSASKSLPTVQPPHETPLGHDERQSLTGAALNNKDHKTQILALGLRVMKDLRLLLKKPNAVVPTMDAFVKILETVEIEDYLEHHRLTDINQVLKSFHHLLIEQKQLWNAFGIIVRGIARQDEIDLLHLGLLASAEDPEVMCKLKESPVKTMMILDAKIFDQKIGYVLPQGVTHDHDGAVDYDILGCPPHRLAYLERNKDRGPILFVSRKLTDSVRYLYYRSGTLKRPGKNDPLVQKIGAVLSHLLTQATSRSIAMRTVGRLDNASMA